VTLLPQAVSYVEQTMHISFAHNSMRIKFEPSEGSMMIDVSTVRALELIENIQNSRCKASLFGLLNVTVTKMGERLLRSNILQPPAQKDIVEKRYAAVQELVSNTSVFAAVRTGLFGSCLFGSSEFL
jgi:DNA mismatch repair protein MSH4